MSSIGMVKHTKEQQKNAFIAMLPVPVLSAEGAILGVGIEVGLSSGGGAGGKRADFDRARDGSAGLGRATGVRASPTRFVVAFHTRSRLIVADRTIAGVCEKAANAGDAASAARSRIVGASSSARDSRSRRRLAISAASAPRAKLSFSSSATTEDCALEYSVA